MKSSAAPTELTLLAMLQKKDLARAVKLKLRRGQVGVLVAVSRGILRALRFSPFARVVKLVDTGDLKSPGHCGRAGSSPAPGTTIISIKTYI